MKRKFLIGAFIEKDGRLLLIRKDGKWEIPTSSLDKGVNILNDLKRDMKALTGLEIEPEAVVGIFEDLLEDEIFIRIYFKTRIVGGKVKSEEKFSWFTPNEIYDMEPEERGRVTDPLDNYVLEKFMPLNFIAKFKGM